MIGTIDIKCNAAHPNLPLSPLYTFKDSPSSVRVMDVPKKVGNWSIDKVALQITYPDGSIVSKECVKNGALWVGTIEGTTTIGKVQKGFVVVASGKNENGEVVNGYVLGVGDVVVMDFDGTIETGTTATNIHLLTSMPQEPKTGDAYLDGNALMVYDGTTWVKIGDQDLSGYVKIGNNQLSQDQTISFTNDNDSIEIKADRIKVAKQGGGTLITHNQIWMVPQYGSSYIIVGDSMYGGIVNIGGNAIVLQGDSQTSSIKLNGNKVLTENELEGLVSPMIDEAIGQVLTQEEF